MECKYGENPQQEEAGLYGLITSDTFDPLAIDGFRLIEGTNPSYVNLCDIDRLLQTIIRIAAGFEVNGWGVPKIAIGAKHGNACGAAVGDDSHEVLKRMLDGDPRAIFGGIVMANFAILSGEAETLIHYNVSKGRRILDGVVASTFLPSSVEILKRKEGKCKLLENSNLVLLSKDSIDSNKRFKSVRGGLLLQSNYTFVLDWSDKNIMVTNPDVLTEDHKKSLTLAWAIGCTSNSNTITIVKDNMLIGPGNGQQDRVSAAELAVRRAKDAGHSTEGAVAYSDSFFPFPDGAEVLIDAGISAVFATSGSIRDEEVRDVFRESGVPFVQLPNDMARGFFGH